MSWRLCVIFVKFCTVSASSNVMYEHEYPNRRTIPRRTENYSYQFEDVPGHSRTKDFWDQETTHKRTYNFEPMTNLERDTRDQHQWRIKNDNYEAQNYRSNDAFNEDLNDQAAITIEQFVAELKKRLELKELRTKKQSETESKDKFPNRLKNGKKSSFKKNETHKHKPVRNEKPKKQIFEKSKKTRTPKKIKVTSGSKGVPRLQQERKNSKGSKSNKNNIRKPKPVNVSAKIKKRPPPIHESTFRPTKNPKTFHKPKVIKTEKDEKDLFQTSNTNSLRQSSHHVHHHDHLEAHKHHHKHKESHEHDHAHSNDHVHNHKHTHNHVHNHIHKHNEAHEHTAEHSHTEKHHHKHLEYIDAGGWRRRNDPLNEPIIDIAPQFSPISKDNKKDSENPNFGPLLKSKFQEYIKSIADKRPSIERAFEDDAPYMQPAFQQYEDEPDEINDGQILLDDEITIEEYQKRYGSMEENDFSEKSLQVFEGTSIDDQFIDRSSSNNVHLTEDTSKLLDLIPADQKNKYPVEVEEISYEEYLELQKKGDVFEEPLEEEEELVQPEPSYLNSYYDQESLGTTNNIVRLNVDGTEVKSNIGSLDEKIAPNVQHLLTKNNQAEQMGLLVNPKNEIGFSTHDGFKTLPMTIKHEVTEHRINTNLFQTAPIQDNQQQLWGSEVLEAENRMDDIQDIVYDDSVYVVDPSQNLKENMELRQPRLSQSSSIFLKNEEEKIMRSVGEPKKHSKSGRSLEFPPEFWNSVVEKIKQELDEEMEEDTVQAKDMFAIDADSTSNNDREIQIASSTPSAIITIKEDSDKENITNDDESNNEEVEYNDYNEQIVAAYDYRDFGELQLKEADNSTRPIENLDNNTVSTESDSNSDVEQPHPVFVVYPLTMNAPETDSMKIDGAKENGSTEAKVVEIIASNRTEYSIDYDKFL